MKVRSSFSLTYIIHKFQTENDFPSFILANKHHDTGALTKRRPDNNPSAFSALIFDSIRKYHTPPEQKSTTAKAVNAEWELTTGYGL